VTINLAGGIAVVVGHTDEPSYGVKPGIHDGEHELEVTLSDNATGLPIGDAQLKTDNITLLICSHLT